MTPALRTLTARYPTANRVATACVRGLEDLDWRLEIAKAAADEAFVHLGARAPGADGLRQRFARGGRAERAVLGVVAGARFRVSAGLARAWFLAVAARHGSRPAGAAPPLTVAVHGEVSNRTRHVLRALGDRPVRIVVLGRPSSPLAEVQVAFRTLGITSAELVRPFDLPTALASRRAGRRAVAEGAPALRAAGLLPRWRDELAFCYRAWQGAASEAWWRRHGWSTPRVVFGHTGLADTGPLERAMQRSGVETVHWVHGVSCGWNFTGVSSVALFHCGYDAALHRALPAYGRTTFAPAERPASVAPGRGPWLLLSNLAHPWNSFTGRGGVELERLTLEACAEAARAAGRSLVWRPHPAFWTLPAAEVAALVARSRALGVECSEARAPMPDLREPEIVLCTPSTTALDALRVGVVPVIISPCGVLVDTVYARLPLRASDAAGVGAAAARVRAGEPGLFEAAWEAALPGRTIRSWADLDAALASS